MVAGAVVGVLGTLLTVALLVGMVDSHYVTRREYDVTLAAIHTDIAAIRADQTALLGRRTIPSAP